LARYRKGWTIGTAVRRAEICGFNLEASHRADPAKLATRIAWLTLASGFACKAGLALPSFTPVRRKVRSRPEPSIIAYGLDAIRKSLRQAVFPRRCK
jgi:hypothetical protein